MKSLVTLVLTLSLAFLLNTAPAQVGAGLLLGGVGSQIDGDSWGGYKKLGFNAGGFAWYDFSKRFGIQPEISFGRRGSREVQNGYGQFTLDYVDVPVLLRIHFFEQNGVRITGETGPSANFLLRVQNGFGDLKQDNTQFFRKLNAEYHLGVCAYFNENLGLFFRWSVGMTNLWGAPNQAWLGIRYVGLGLRLAFISKT